MLSLFKFILNLFERGKKMKYIMPVKTPFTITSAYGDRISPITGQSEFHNGVDFASPDGKVQNLYAVGDGLIVYSKPYTAGNAGNVICLACPRDQNTFDVFAYFHCSERYFEIGKKVKKGELIGKSGATGEVTGPHLHFQKQIMETGFGWPYENTGLLKGQTVNPIEDMDQRGWV